MEDNVLKCRDSGETRDCLLELREQGVSFVSRKGLVPITRSVSFCISRGEKVGIVGESGCGKSVTALSVLGLLPRRTARIEGQVLFEGEDLLLASSRRMRQIRGRRIGMIFQEPMTALDPVFTVGEQIAETWRTHFPKRREEARERAVAALAEVGIPLPDRRADEYPHQLSGGMRQRVMIAMALICEPSLLIADEPTTALDVTVQAQVIDLLSDLSERAGTALMFITHDLGVIAETCTRMLTMYAGEVIEDAPVDEVLLRPRHPYTSGLLRSLPRLASRRGVLPSVPGRVPLPGEMPRGCRFKERCAYATDVCAAPQVLRDIGSGRFVRCARADVLDLPGAVA